MSLKATLSLADPGMLDPVQHGLRLLIDDAQGLRYTDLTLPPKPSAVRRSGLAGDVHWLEVPRQGTHHVGEDQARGVGTGRADPGHAGQDIVSGVPPAANLPLKVTAVLDPPYATTGLCAEIGFPGPPGVNPSCTERGSSVTCH
jgi:hypothetical protein